MKHDKREMSYFGRVIWSNAHGGYAVAKGDGTDEHFETIEQAMIYCEEHPRGKYKGGTQA